MISLKIDPEVNLRTDTSAAVHTDGLFDSKFIVLEPGAEKEDLESGEKITFTQDALVDSDLMELIIISKGKAAQAKRKAAETANQAGN